MDGAILPHWFWVIYYSFLLLVLWLGVSNIVKKKNVYFINHCRCSDNYRTIYKYSK